MNETGTYMIVHRATGKLYIGSAEDLQVRLDRHWRDLKVGQHHCVGLQELWNQDPEFNVTFFPKDTRSEAYAFELHLIRKFSQSDRLLNIGLGVQGGDNLTRHPQREAIIEKMVEGLDRRYRSMSADDRKIKYGKPGELNPMFGRTHTDEVRKRLAISSSRPENIARLRASKLSDEGRRSLAAFAKSRTGETNSFFGKSHSEESKRKMAEAKLGSVPPNRRRVVVDEVVYESLSAAAAALNIGSPLLLYRIRSDKDKYRNYRYQEETFNDQRKDPTENNGS